MADSAICGTLSSELSRARELFSDAERHYEAHLKRGTGNDMDYTMYEDARTRLGELAERHRKLCEYSIWIKTTAFYGLRGGPRAITRTEVCVRGEPKTVPSSGASTALPSEYQTSWQYTGKSCRP